MGNIYNDLFVPNFNYEMTHCMRAVSLPPAERSRLSSGKNSTLVTCELCPPLT